MLDQDTFIRTPHSATVTRKGGKRHVKVDDARTSVSMKTHGIELVFFFDDPGRQGPVREIRLLPDVVELDPWVLRRVAPKAPLYLQYARAAMTANDDDWLGSLDALRELGTTRRGLTPEFFRRVAAKYQAIVAQGEPHPVKALSEMEHVKISTASRWITEARRRGFITDPDPRFADYAQGERDMRLDALNEETRKRDESGTDA